MGKIMEAASQEWRSGLIDVGGNNRLLYFKPVKSTVDLSEASEAARERLLEGREVRLAELFPDYTAADAARKSLDAIAKAEQNAAEEYGISIAFAAAGFASWSPEALDPTAGENEGVKNAARRPNAPVLLRPLKLTALNSIQKTWTLQLLDEFEINGVLGHVLEHAGASLSGVLENVVPASSDELEAVYENVAALAGEFDEFTIDESIVLGTFTYTKQPMVDDVSDVTALEQSDLVMALAGDAGAASRVRSISDGVSEDLPDRTPVEDEYLVLDADASQSYVVNAALSGRNMVVQGPPGTGKSQTIANIIASCIARNKSVLFVAQKRAAVSAVLDRLDNVDLSHLVLDLFDAQRSRGYVASRLQEAMERHAQAGPARVADLQQSLTRSRDRLVEHRNAMHEPKHGWGISVFELLALATEIPATVVTPYLEPASTFARWSETQLAQLTAAANELQGLGALWKDWNTRPGWNPTALRDEDTMRHFGAIANHLARRLLPELGALLADSATTVNLPAPANWDEAGILDRQFNEAQRLNQIAPVLVDASITIETLVAAASKFERGPARRAVSGADRRAALRALKEPLSALERRLRGDVLRAVIAFRSAWVGRPTHVAPPGWDRAEELMAEVREQLLALQPAIQGAELAGLSWNELQTFVTALINDTERPKFRRVAELESHFITAGLPNVLPVLRRDLPALPGAHAGDVILRIVTQSLLHEATMYDAGLAGIDRAALDTAVASFRKTDAQHLESNAVRIRRLAALRLAGVLDSEPEQQMRIKKEASRRTRFTPVRRLFDENAAVMLAAQPVWAMSPLQVSRLLPARACFDIVIFDEASQVKPGDAIPALLRAPQAVIAGDSRQLPPTEFFSKVIEAGEELEDDPDEELTSGAATDFSTAAAKPRLGSFTRDTESILIAMDNLLAGQSRSLQWHYRSRDERLIAVSNDSIYGGSLTTFPAADTPDAIRHVVVPPSPGIGKTTNSPEAEVARVVELIKEHVRNRPKESLGVISFGEKHQRRIDQALANARQSDPELDSALDGLPEPFFMKNVERVQGDERDAIILTVGYGKDPETNKLRLFWGPLLQPGGERRLNVAISRSKKRMTLVSSFGRDDLAVDAHPSAGYELIYQFVRFMASGGADLGNPVSKIPLNAFERDIRDRLIATGMQLDAQYGVGSYRLDFAVRHPEKPGRHVLAIEADGASYHSGHTARERDRLRQMLLERRGWRFHRIWSTDWFNDAEGEVRRAVAAYEAALATDDKAVAAKSENTDTYPTGAKGAWEQSVGKRTLPRPHFQREASIADYPMDLLIRVVQHVRSDLVARTAAEEFELVFRELGFSRKGSRIAARIEEAQQRTPRHA